MSNLAFINFYGSQLLIENRILIKDRDSGPIFENLNIGQILFVCVVRFLILSLVSQNFPNILEGLASF